MIAMLHGSLLWYKRNSRVYRKWVNRGENTCGHDKVREVRNLTNKLIKEAKLAYYNNLGNNISDPTIGHTFGQHTKNW